MHQYTVLAPFLKNKTLSKYIKDVNLNVLPSLFLGREKKKNIAYHHAVNVSQMNKQGIKFPKSLQCTTGTNIGR
jgi:hypothetical protein